MAERLLVVEEDTLCKLLQRGFIRDGYEVDRAEDAESPLNLFQHFSHDLNITDIILPDMSGIELLTKYRKTKPSRKMIIITAYASLATASHPSRRGKAFGIARKRASPPHSQGFY